MNGQSGMKRFPFKRDWPDSDGHRVSKVKNARDVVHFILGLFCWRYGDKRDGFCTMLTGTVLKRFDQNTDKYQDHHDSAHEDFSERTKKPTPKGDLSDMKAFRPVASCPTFTEDSTS